MLRAEKSFSLHFLTRLRRWLGGPLRYLLTGAFGPFFETVFYCRKGVGNLRMRDLSLTYR